MTPEEFAQKIKAKYPQYGNIPDAELAQKMVAKYPQYRSQIKQAPTTKQPLANRTANALGLGGVVDTLGTNFAQIGNALDFKTPLAQRYDRSEAIGRTTLKQNIGAGAALGSLVAGGATAAPMTLAKTVGIASGLGAASAGGASMAANEDTNTNIRKAAVGAATSGAVAGAIGGIGKLVSKVGDKIQISVIKPTKPDIEDGFKMETIKKYDLGGSLNRSLTKTQEKLNALTSQLNQKLSATDGRIDLNTVAQETIQELTDGSKLKGFGANVKVQNVVNSLKEEIALIGDNSGAASLSIPEAQIVKQASGNFGAWQFGKPDPDSKATEIVYNTFYNKLKTAIEKSSPEGVKAINKEISELIPVLNAVIRRLPVAERAGAISLNEMIGLVGSSVNPIALGPTLLAMISRSGTAGRVLSKVGEKIASPAIAVGVVSGLPAAQAAGKGPTPSQSQKSTSTDATMSGIKVKGPLSGKEFEIAPGGAALRTIKLGGQLSPKALGVLKQALIKALEKAPRQPKIEYAEEAENILDMMKTLKGPLDKENIRRALEVLRLQGKDVKPFLDFIEKYTTK